MVAIVVLAWAWCVAVQNHVCPLLAAHSRSIVIYHGVSVGLVVSRARDFPCLSDDVSDPGGPSDGIAFISFDYFPEIRIVGSWSWCFLRRDDRLPTPRPHQGSGNMIFLTR